MFWSRDDKTATPDGWPATRPRQESSHIPERDESPPPFDDTQPPDFSPYEADVKIKRDTTLVSHDPHLNEDGEALYRFLLEQATKSPIFFMGCQGTYQVRRYDGSTWYWATVTDFAFKIPIPLLEEPNGAPIFILGDKEATPRGTSLKEVLVESTRESGPSTLRPWRKATDEERAATKARRLRCAERGLPPWVRLANDIPGMVPCLDSERDRLSMQDASTSPTIEFSDDSLQAPSRGLRQWADDYCSRDMKMKEFNFRKVVYGWDLGRLRDLVYRTLASSWSSGHRRRARIHVWFDTACDIVSVQPPTWMSRLLSNKLFKGGEWRVSGAAYALKRWVHLDDSVPGESSESYRIRMRLSSLIPLKATPRGVSRLDGLLEDEWFRTWQSTLSDCARRRFYQRNFLTVPLSSMPSGSRG